MTIADLIIKIGVDTKAAEAELTGFAGSVHKGFRKALVPAAAAIGVAAIGAKKLIDAASDMNETVSKTKTVFGASSAGVIKWGDTLAKGFGISKQAGLDAASMFGTFGKAAGKTGPALANFSKPLVQAAADLASFHNVPVAQSLEDIRSGLAGEVEPLRKYGILLNDAALRQQALKMGLVDSTKNALSPQNKMLAAQALILKDLGPAQGDFARTSSSAANTARIQAAEVANLKANLGAGLLPAYQMLQGVLLTVTGVMASHQGVVKIVAAALLGLAIAIVAVNVAMTLAASPIYLILIALAALAAGLVYAYQHCEAFRNIVNAAFQMIQQVAQVVIAWLVANVPAAWATIKADSVAVWNAIVAIVTEVWGRIRGVVMAALSAVKGLIQADLNIIKGIINVVMGLIHGDWSRVWEGIKQITSGVLQGIVALIRGVIGVAAAAAAALGKAILDGIVNMVKLVAARVVAALSSLWTELIGLAGRALRAGLAIGKAIIDGIAQGITGAIGGAISAIEGAGGSLLSHAKKFFHINSPSLLFAREIGSPIMEGIERGIADRLPYSKGVLNVAGSELLDAAKGGMASDPSALLSPFQDAKHAVDDWAGSKGVDNFTGVGAQMAGALRSGFVGGYSGNSGPLAVTGTMPKDPTAGVDPMLANAIRAGEFDNASDVYLDGHKVGKVMRSNFYGVKRRTGGLGFEG